MRIAIIDSGVHASHPHVGAVASGIGIDDDGALTEDCIDRLGHGTAVAAAIREKAPHADIFPIKACKWRSISAVKVATKMSFAGSLSGSGLMD